MKSKSRPVSAVLLHSFTLIVLLSIALGAAAWVWKKHEFLESQIAALEPRHARLLGLKASAEALEQNLSAAKAELARKSYSADQDTTQAGNAAQQQVRTLFTDSKLDVISIQVLPPKELKFFDRIGILVRVEGDLVGIHNATTLLHAQAPTVWVDNLTIQTVGLVKPKSSQRLAAQFNLSVLRSRN